MSYGFEVFNALGDRVLEFKKTLQVASSGVTRPFSDLKAEAVVIADAAGYTTPRVDFPHYSLNGYQIATQVPYAANLNGSVQLGAALELEFGDTVFYRIDSFGIIQQMQVFCDLPGGYPVNKGVGYVYSEGGTNTLPYIVASTGTAVPGGQTHGLIMYDATGAVTFDSRKPMFSIFYGAVVPKTVFDSVILTNTPHVITLPKSVAGAYVSLPAFVNYDAYSNGANFQAMVKQTAGDQLTISRVNIGGPVATGVRRTWTQDTPIFVGRPI